VRKLVRIVACVALVAGALAMIAPRQGFAWYSVDAEVPQLDLDLTANVTDNGAAIESELEVM